MPLLERTAHTRAQRTFFLSFFLLVLIAPFYYQPNLGGEGLMLPYSASIWIAGLLTMAAGLLAMLSRATLIIPRHSWLLMLFPAGLVLGGFLTGIERPSEWLVRLGVIVGGILFWFSLFQFRLTRRQLDAALYLLLASIMLQGLIGLSQLLPESPLSGYIPYVSKGAPAGVYQQPNLHASMMATGVALALYMATTPAFPRLSWPFRSLVLITLLLCTTNIFSTGSRVGLLGFAVVVVLIVAGRARLLLRRKLTATLLLLSLVTGASGGIAINSGVLTALGKLDRLTGEGVSSDARPHIYRVAWQRFLDAPLIGHGIGSFQREFQDERIEYYATEPNYVLDDKRFSHPHNELLFWMIEGGTLAILALAAGAAAVLWQLIQLGWQRGLALAATLFPITLHTQVELPFYISNVHWFVLMILLFLCFRNGRRERPVPFSDSARVMIRGATLVIPALLITFLTHSLVANAGIIQFMRSKGSEPGHLQLALNNIYFREMGEFFWMRTLLYRDIQLQQRDNTGLFIEWANQYLEQIPDKQVYQDLARAYLYLGQRDAALRTLARVRAIYPDDEQLARVEQQVERGELSAGSTAAASAAASPAQPPASPAQ